MDSFPSYPSCLHCPSFEELEKQHFRLINEIRDFDLHSSLPLCAALLTIPSFHAHTIRIEILQHLIHRNAKGSKYLTVAHLERWLNIHLKNGYAWRSEDPVEDVFISNVITSLGNNRIFEGIWEANDFCLQDALNAWRGMEQTPEVTVPLIESFALIYLSELLAKRCNLPRFCMGSGTPRNELKLPSDQKLYERAQYLYFSQENLKQIRILNRFLKPFIHDDNQTTGEYGNSTIEKRPLLKIGSTYLLMLPTAVSPAVRKYLIEAALRLKILGKFQESLANNQMHLLLNEGFKPLGADEVDSEFLPNLPSGLPITKQFLGNFDEDKFIHILFCEDNLADFHRAGLNGALILNSNQTDQFLNHVNSVAHWLSNRPNCSGGLTVLIFGGLGRALALIRPQFSKGWHFSFFRLSDFIQLAKCEKIKMLDIWKLHREISNYNRDGIEIENINGELNLIGHWYRCGCRLIPRYVNYKKNALIMVATDCISEIRQISRLKHDTHALTRRNPNVWVIVSRLNTNPFFKEIENDPIYASYGDIFEGHIRGAIETSKRAWWVSVIAPLQIPWHRDLQFRIWETIIQWLLPISLYTEGNIQNLPDGPIEIFLQFPDLPQWTDHRIDLLPQAAELHYEINDFSKAITLHIPLGFFRFFAEPRNTAECKLIQAILDGIAQLSRHSFRDDELQNIVKSIARNNDARFFHLAYAKSYRHHISHKSIGPPRFIKQEDINYSTLNISWRINGTQVDAITDHQSCNKFLHKVVDDYWIKIQSKLLLIDRDSLIRKCFENIDAIAAEKTQWELTAKALLACHNERHEVINAAQNRYSLRNAAELTSRILIEMAICSCSENPSKKINFEVFDSLMADIYQLIDIANYSDALKYGLTESKIEIFPNGEFSLNEDYRHTIIHPYLSGYFIEQFNSAADSYESHYEDPRTSESERKKIFTEDFETAFSSEYGLTSEELLNVCEKISDDGIAQDKLIIAKRKQDLFKLIEYALESDGNKTEQFMSHFVLSPRPQWNATSSEFQDRDWHPWRFRRRLSLLARPLVACGNDNTSNVIYSPALITDAIILLLYRVNFGHLPAEYFHSPQMRAFVGETNRDQGERFERTVTEEFQKNGLKGKSSTPMTELGADETYGDLDSYAWDGKRSIFYAIECKRLRYAITTAEIGEQLRNFKGEQKDKLAKHLRRCKWLTLNIGAVLKLLKIYPRDATPTVVSLLVTNTPVPMQFVEDLPLSSKQIISFNKISEFCRIKNYDT